MRFTSVGSFPMLPEVRQSKRDPDVVRKATVWWIRQQEKMGYDILVHGEQERSDMVAYFGDCLGGFTPGTEPVRSYGNRYWKPPLITGEISWLRAMTVESWSYAQSLTTLPVKGMLTGPGTIYDWSIDVHYGSREDAVQSIGLALREEIKALIKAGCKIIQIDEPSLVQHPDKIEFLREVFELMLKDLEGYFILHTCYGGDTFETVLPELIKFPVHNLDIETSNNGMQILDIIKRNPSDMDYSIGVVDVHDHQTEDVEVVRSRIKEALKVVSSDKLWIGPDCGLKTRSVEEAVSKLQVIADARLGA